MLSMFFTHKSTDWNNGNHTRSNANVDADDDSNTGVDPCVFTDTGRLRIILYSCGWEREVGSCNGFLPPLFYDLNIAITSDPSETREDKNRAF